MAIVSVNATLDKRKTELNQTQEDNERYEGNIQAPEIQGDYSVEISAYDDAGNVSVAGKLLEVSKWRQPKINWKPTDPVNFTDYNRIKNNLEYLCETGCLFFRPFSIKDMGENKKGYSDYTYADEWNLFEENLDIINNNTIIRNYGERQYFFDNTHFIMWDELNRIENAILEIGRILNELKQTVPKLKIRLGNYKGVKV